MLKQKIMETKEPFILSLTHYDTTITVEKDRSDLTIEEVVRMFKTLLLGATFNEEQVNEYLNVD